MGLENKLRASISLAGYGMGAAEGKADRDWVWRSSGNFVNTFQTADATATALDISGATITGATIMLSNHSMVADVEIMDVTNEVVFAKIPPGRSMLWVNGANSPVIKASGGATTAEVEIMFVEA
tara:strand:+ start:93 stop:464 length:372 start_codon:yes stop_codon:yes gene_type:complete